MRTIDYYNKHAEEFIHSTLQIDMESLYRPFLTYLPDSARILDLGCGSGRDALAFKNRGYEVEAIDYSALLVKKATELTGIQVRYQSFYMLDELEKYHGIWACASLLHCDRERLPDVLQRILNALKINGILYMSFKYGEDDREREGRKFTDLNECQAEALLNLFNGITPIKQWLTVDQRPDHEEKWLNLLWRKYA